MRGQKSGLAVRARCVPRRLLRSARLPELLALFVTAALLASCVPTGPAPLNLLLVSADSLRSDRLALYATDGVPVPALEDLASRGVVYRNAFAVTPWTAPSMVSVFTGLYPPSHGVQVRDDTTPVTLPTLPRMAEAAGLRVGNFSFFSGISYFRNLGFPPPPEGLAHGREPEVFARWLDEEPERGFFAWIHLLEPHLPYGASGYRAKDLQIEGSSGLEASQLGATVPVGTAEFEAGDRAKLLELYDQDVARFDARLAELVDVLAARELLDSTLIVVVADHGEELLEDGWVGHASTAAEAKLLGEIVRIPLVVSGPGVRDQGGESGALVQQVDVLAAVASAFGWPTPDVLDGRGLPGVGRPRILGGPSPRAHVFFDSSVGGNLTADDRRLDRLQGVSDGRCLFSVASSPGGAAVGEMLQLGDAPCSGPDPWADLLAEWQQDQAAQRLEVLRLGAEEPPPPDAEIDGYALTAEVIGPAVSAALDWREQGGLIALRWQEEAPVWVQYDVGEGLLAVKGAFRVDQPRGISFGPFPEGFWNDLAGYSPFRFRILDEVARTRSEWRSFTLDRVEKGTG